MSKRLMSDETSRFPRFERIVVFYECGCSYFNDSWEKLCETALVCPEHKKPKKANTSEGVRGNRPVNTQTKKHTMKIN